VRVPCQRVQACAKVHGCNGAQVKPIKQIFQVLDQRNTANIPNLPDQLQCGPHQQNNLKRSPHEVARVFVPVQMLHFFTVRRARDVHAGRHHN
jgi:hypothetical protein